LGRAASAASEQQIKEFTAEKSRLERKIQTEQTAFRRKAKSKDEKIEPQSSKKKAMKKTLENFDK
jgi:hypothetical protein